ncbi:MAG TPA: hypothetical protein VJC20_02105 [Candidatus Paceibacterota bacterium]
MSHTLPADVFSPSYWLVMARVMYMQIKKIVAKKRVEEQSIPRGVLADAKNFFALVQSHIDTSAHNLPAALNAYMIARHTMPRNLSREEAVKELKILAELVSTLNNNPRELADAEHLVAKRLGQFFSRLAVISNNVANIELARGGDWWSKEGHITYFRDVW